MPKYLTTENTGFLKNYLVKPIADVGQEELNTRTTGQAIREWVHTDLIGSYVSPGRVGNSSSSALGITNAYSPILAFGGGDMSVLMAFDYIQDSYFEKSVSVTTLSNGGGLRQRYLATIDWTRSQINSQKATATEIQSIFN